jgi:hypothetical protein
MIKTKTISKVIHQEAQEDVLCDICSKSCGTQIYNEEGEAFLRFEYMQLEAFWGYYSSKDEEQWVAQVCESCVDTHLVPMIKFTKSLYTSRGKRRLVP